METSQKSISDAINVLSGRTSLLDPSHLDHVEGRLSALQSKMNLVVEKKQQIEDEEKVNKIGVLFNLVQKSQAMAGVLPGVVDRLDALQELHEQGKLNKACVSSLIPPARTTVPPVAIIIFTRRLFHVCIWRDIDKWRRTDNTTCKNNGSTERD